MQVLVTGGGGFVGAWIIRRLAARGCRIRVLETHAHRGLVEEIAGAAVALDWRIGDVTDRACVAEAATGCDAALHLAAVLTPACRADPVRGAEINLVGTLNVFEAAGQHGLSRVVYMSSAGVFGPDDGTTPFPTTHYGAFKLACEGSARAYWERDGTASVGFRPYIVYGPGRETGLTAGPSLACRAAARGEPYTIPFRGPADLVHVEDVAAAFEAALFRPGLSGAPVFNLLGAVATTDEIMDGIRRHVPGARLSADGPLLPITARITPDPDLDILLPGLPHTPLLEGLGRTIDHYRSAEEA